MDRLRDPERVFIGMGVAFDMATWVFYLAAIVWWTVDLGFGPLQLVLLGTAMEVTALVCEIPTGVVADRFSRKWSVVTAFVLMSIAMLLAAATEAFAVMLVSQALFGIGWTFRSGADVAWLTDEMHARADGPDTDIDQSNVLMRRHRIGMTSGLVALIPAIAFGGSSLRLIIVICGVFLSAATVLLALAMTDHFRDRRDLDEHPYTMRQILREGATTARRVPSIRTLLIVMVLLGLGAESLDRLGFKQFLDEGDFGDDSLVFTGVLFIALAALGIVVVWLTERRVAAGSSLAVLAVVLLALASTGALIAALAPAIGIAVGMAMQDPCREALFPVSQAWANRDAPERSRATVHSFVGQANGVGNAVGGIALASLAEVTGIRWAILAAAVLWAVAAAVAARSRSAVPPTSPSRVVRENPQTETA